MVVVVLVLFRLQLQNAVERDGAYKESALADVRDLLASALTISGVLPAELSFSSFDAAEFAANDALMVQHLVNLGSRLPTIRGRNTDVLFKCNWLPAYFLGKAYLKSGPVRSVLRGLPGHERLHSVFHVLTAMRASVHVAASEAVSADAVPDYVPLTLYYLHATRVKLLLQLWDSITAGRTSVIASSFANSSVMVEFSCPAVVLHGSLIAVWVAEELSLLEVCGATVWDSGSGTFVPGSLQLVRPSLYNDAATDCLALARLPSGCLVPSGITEGAGWEAFSIEARRVVLFLRCMAAVDEVVSKAPRNVKPRNAVGKVLYRCVRPLNSSLRGGFTVKAIDCWNCQFFRVGA